MKGIIIPSLVGVGETDLGLLSLGELGRKMRSSLPHSVTFDGATYLVGEGLTCFARPIERMDLQRLGDGPEARPLTYTSLGMLLGPGQHTVSLMVGLPVEVMSDRQAALQSLSSLRLWLKGEHCFEVDQLQISLTIAAINVMAQPAGAFFAWGLDEYGRWVRSVDDLKAPVGICDIGFNTLDVFSVEGGQVLASFTGGDTLGMRRAAEILTRAVKTRHGVRLSLHEADALLRERHPELHTSSGKVDLSAMVRQVLEATTGQVVAFLESRWGNGRQFAHLLATGGGALALKDALLHASPHLVVLPEPISANATGLARYARRAFKGAELVIGLEDKVDIANTNCAGLDVHKRTVVASFIVPGKKETRTFETMTTDLLTHSDWPTAEEVTHVAMESTGEYWKPVFNILADNFVVLLVNAQHIKSVPGRKTDIKDAEWIADLLCHGLLKASFIPPAGQREGRELTRYRSTFVKEKDTLVNRV